MLSVIIPTYEERESIPLLIGRLFPLLPAGSEIIVVDDSSPDGTADSVRAISQKNPSVRLLVRPKKSGLAGAVSDGVAIAKGDWILVMDADLSHPPESVPALIEKSGGCDLVIGRRASVQNWPFHRKLISRGAEAIARLFLGISAPDPLSGFFLVKKGIFQRTRFRAKGYKLLLNIIFDNPKIKICGVPYAFRDRYAGKTKLGTSEMLRYVRDVLSIRFG